MPVKLILFAGKAQINHNHSFFFFVALLKQESNFHQNAAAVSDLVGVFRLISSSLSVCLSPSPRSCLSQRAATEASQLLKMFRTRTWRDRGAAILTCRSEAFKSDSCQMACEKHSAWIEWWSHNYLSQQWLFFWWWSQTRPALISTNPGLGSLHNMQSHFSWQSGFFYLFYFSSFGWACQIDRRVRRRIIRGTELSSITVMGWDLKGGADGVPAPRSTPTRRL